MIKFPLLQTGQGPNEDIEVGFRDGPVVLLTSKAEIFLGQFYFH